MSAYLWLNASLTQGGSERVMTLLANAFADRGLDSKMVLLREGKARTYAVSPQLPVEQLHYPTRRKALLLPFRLIAIRKLVKRENPGCVICFMWDLNAQVLLSCLGLGKKIVVSERNDPRMSAQNALRRFTEKRLYRHAYRVVFQTEEVRSCYLKKIQERSVVIPNPIDPDLPEPWKGPRERQIVAAGRLNRQKNFPLLIGAFADFRKTHPDWTMIIYGEGTLRKELEQQIDKAGLTDSVRLPGFTENLPEKIKKAGMFVSSSDYEGISNVMLEAMAMELPCVCTDSRGGGAAMVIRNGENGLLVPTGDREALGRAMARIADEGGLTEKLGREAGKVRETFSMETIVRKWKEACE